MEISKFNYLTACGILELTVMEDGEHIIFNGVFNNYYNYPIALQCDITIPTYYYKTGKIKKRDIIERMIEGYRRMTDLMVGFMN